MTDSQLMNKSKVLKSVLLKVINVPHSLFPEIKNTSFPSSCAHVRSRSNYAENAAHHPNHTVLTHTF